MFDWLKKFFVVNDRLSQTNNKPIDVAPVEYSPEAPIMTPITSDSFQEIKNSVNGLAEDPTADKENINKTNQSLV